MEDDDQYVVMGETLTLTCVARPSSHESTDRVAGRVSLQFQSCSDMSDVFYPLPTDRVRRFNDTSVLLTIADATIAQQGLYRCCTVGDVGAENCSSPVQVHVGCE